MLLMTPNDDGSWNARVEDVAGEELVSRTITFEQMVEVQRKFPTGHESSPSLDEMVELVRSV